MAQNYVSRGEVITVSVGKEYKSGNPHRIKGFNGVALIDVVSGDEMSFQLEGVFEFALADVKFGDLIGITSDDRLTLNTHPEASIPYARAVTGSDKNGKFYCRIIQHL